MSDERDRLLAQLLVEGGFLSRDEAARYWQRIQAPNAPRLGALLVQEGRLSPADLEVLRARFMERTGVLQAQRATPPGAAAVASRPAGRLAPQAAPAPGAAAPAGQRGSQEDWEEALEKDALLAKALLSRGATTQERLRECRALQVQHRVRLGVALVRKGYVDKQVVEEAIALVRQHRGESTAAHLAAPTPAGPPPTGGYARPPDPDDAPTLMEQPPAPLPALGANPFARAPRGPDADDAQATLLDEPESGLEAFTPRGPQGQDQISTLLQQPNLGPNPPALPAMGLSAEELNPFRDLPLPGPASSFTDIPMATPASPFGTPGAPAPGRPVQQSVDELDVFADVPLGPPPSPPAQDGDGATLPPSYLVGGPGGEGSVTRVPGYKASGMTPTGVPVGGMIDSDSANVKAPRRGEQAKAGGGSKLKLLLLLGGAGVFVLLVIALLIWSFVL